MQPFKQGQLSYQETTAADFASAVAAAKATLGAGGVEVVAVQVDGDVFVFADGGSTNTIQESVMRGGRSLADISASNLF